jgi:hypothetical protein
LAIWLSTGIAGAQGPGQSKPKESKSKPAAEKPDPRVAVALRGVAMKGRARGMANERVVTSNIGACIPAFQPNLPYTKEEQDRVAKANECLDKIEPTLPAKAPSRKK